VRVCVCVFALHPPSYLGILRVGVVWVRGCVCVLCLRGVVSGAELQVCEVRCFVMCCE